MFYFKQINSIGCILWMIILIWLFFILKLYYVIGFIILLAFIYSFYLKTKNKIINNKEEKERHFEPEMGEVYKICPVCGNNIKRSTKICPHCKSKLE